MLRKVLVLLACFSALLLASCGGGSDNNNAIHVGSPPFLFATTASGTIVGFQLTPATGALTRLQGSPFTYPNADPFGIVSNGTNIYTANSSQQQIGAFAFDAQTGALSSVVGSPVHELGLRRTVGSTELRVCRNHLFANDPEGFVSTFNFDPAVPGGLRPVAGREALPPGGPVVSGLAVPPSCQFSYFASPNRNVVGGYGFNPDESTSPTFAIALGVGPSVVGPTQVAVDQAGHFLIVANAISNNVSVYSIDATNGNITNIPGSPFAAGTAPSYVAVQGNFVYVTNGGDNTISSFSLDANTGVLTQVGSPIATGSLPISITTFASYLYVANATSNDISAYAMQANGALQQLAGSPFPVGAQPRQMTVAQGPQ